MKLPTHLLIMAVVLALAQLGCGGSGGGASGGGNPGSPYAGTWIGQFNAQWDEAVNGTITGHKSWTFNVSMNMQSTGLFQTTRGVRYEVMQVTQVVITDPCFGVQGGATLSPPGTAMLPNPTENISSGNIQIATLPNGRSISAPTPLQDLLHVSSTGDVISNALGAGQYGWQEGTPVGVSSCFASQVSNNANPINLTKTFTFSRSGGSIFVPYPPTGITATPASGQNQINWDNVAGATAYNIYWSTTSGVNKTNGTKIPNVTSPYTHTGLTNGTIYYYVVTAVNGSGESPVSSEISATPHLAPPAAPGYLVASGEGGADRITWDAAAGATSYNIYWSTTSGVTKSNGTKIANVTSPYTHTGLMNGTTYYYVVTASNSAGESAESSQVSATPQQSAPAGVSAIAEISQDQISWNPATWATSYNIYWSTTSGVNKSNGVKIGNVTSPFTHTALTNGTTYYYVVTAVNAGGESFESGQVSVTPQLRAPFGVTALGGNGQNEIIWTAVGGATGYNIYWSTTSGVNKANGTKISSASTPYTQIGLTNGTTYYYVVTTLSGGLESTESSQVTATPAVRNLIGGSMQGYPLALGAVVHTFAGAANTVGSNDGTGTAARFNSPYGVTTDGTNLYVADTYNRTIRKIVIATGVVSTLAGSPGQIGSIDGTGTAARFDFPYAITTDGTNLYIGDYDGTVREVVIATGTVSTLAGSAYSFGSTDGTGSAARFGAIYGITTDGTNLYVSDTGNNTIRKVVISTGAVTTLAGSPGSSGSSDGTGSAARFKTPDGITTDGTNLYVADSGNDTIRKIVISTGAVTTFAGSAGTAGWADGTGTAATFNYPFGITTEGTNLYVGDAGGYIIRRIVVGTRAVSTVAGSPGSYGSTDGTGSVAQFFGPSGLTTDGTNLFVADNGNNEVRIIQ